MTLENIKNEMLEFKDFYGGDFSEWDEIKNAKTKSELAAIIDRRNRFFEDMLSDAMSHLSNFKKKLGLEMLP